MPHHPHLRAVRPRLVLAVISALAMVSAFVAPASAHPTPTPTLSVSAATDPTIAQELTGVPDQAMPYVLTAVGVPFEVTVSLSAPLTKDLDVALEPNGSGTLADTQVVIPAGSTRVTVDDETYSVATAALQIIGNPDYRKMANASSPAFPVEANLDILSGHDSGLLGGTVGADGSDCAGVDPAHPICGVLSLPHGASGNVALSLGPCPAHAKCAAGNVVTQFIADMTDSNGNALYTRTDPARMTIVCDKSLCGSGGVPKYRALWSQSATGDLVVTPKCPGKGVIGAGQDFCTDTVSSRRDNAGNLLLVVLFLQDVRGTI